MEPSSYVLIGFAVWAIVFGGLGIYMAVQKGREPFEGLAMGVLFGPLGCVLTGLLPTVETKPTPVVKPAPRITRARDEIDEAEEAAAFRHLQTTPRRK